MNCCCLFIEKKKNYFFVSATNYHYKTGNYMKFTVLSTEYLCRKQKLQYKIAIVLWKKKKRRR